MKKSSETQNLPDAGATGCAGTAALSRCRTAIAGGRDYFISGHAALGLYRDGLGLSAHAQLIDARSRVFDVNVFDTAIGLARSLGATVCTISVKEPFPYSAVTEVQPTPPQEFFDAQQRLASERVEAVRTACAKAGVTCEAYTVEALHAWEAIIEHAKQNACDLLVMASHGRRGMTALLLGSETQKVLTHSKLPVLVVR